MVFESTFRVASRVVLGEPRSSRIRIDAFAGPLECTFAELSRVDQSPFYEVFFGEHDRRGVRLFSAGAAGVPNLELRVGSKDGDDVLTKRAKEARVAEHLAHLDREVV